MLCEECGKNEATVHIQALMPDGSTMDRSLCQRCMSKLRAMPGIHALDISEFLGALIGQIHQSRMEKESDRFDATCPGCGLTYAEFKKNLACGCADCYKAFREPIEEMLVRRNGSALYVDKAPGSEEKLNSDIYQVKKLREEMQKAVQEERFETAASIRDEIRALEEKLSAERKNEYAE
ncbi:MAG: UvrB/UvrC motif-containing protein [Clostridia bacterium]|nr:UvrB/UvrC motif-containing protein [Clostridia bacterium]